MARSDNYRLSFSLYRAALGNFEFRGPARLYFDPRFGVSEHHLLEVHEHNHWQLAHSTIFGLHQLALAYAYLLAKNEDQKNRYRTCLHVVTDASRDLYEGCAVYNEKIIVETGRREVHPQWFAVLESTVYQLPLRQFESFLSGQPFPPILKASIADNVAELSLNSVPRFLWRPARLDVDKVGEVLSTRSPNSIFSQLCMLLAKEPEQFSASIRRDAIEPTAREFGLNAESFSSEALSEVVSRRLSGALSFRTYVAIRDLALRNGIEVFEGDPMVVDLVRYDIWLTWVRGLPGHERFYPNLVEDVATFKEADLSSERYDFETFRTSFEPPSNDEFDDLEISEWGPVIGAMEFGKQCRHRLYVSLNDGLGGWPLKLVLSSVPLVGFVGGDTQTFGSALSTTMSVEEGRRRFDEEIAQPEPSHIIFRAGRAVFKPRAGYGWRHLGARYKFPVPKDSIAIQLNRLSELPFILTIRWRNLNLETLSAFEVPIRSLRCTVGVLVEESSVYGWVRIIKKLAELKLDNKLHCVFLGSKPDYLFIINVVHGVDGSRLFVFSLASVHLFHHLKSIVDGDNDLNSKAKWVGNLREAGANVEFMSDILLACEHIVRRGY